MQTPNANRWNIGRIFSVEYGLKAYIPLHRKTICVGSWRWLTPPTPQFRVGDNNMLVSKNAKICITRKAKYKICVTPNAKPKREPMEYNFRVGRVHFMLFVLI